MGAELEQQSEAAKRVLTASEENAINGDWCYNTSTDSNNPDLLNGYYDYADSTDCYHEVRNEMDASNYNLSVMKETGSPWAWAEDWDDLLNERICNKKEQGWDRDEAEERLMAVCQVGAERY